MSRNEVIQLSHGSGGRMSQRLISEIIKPRLSNATLDAMEDAALVARPDRDLRFTTDAFVVQPLFFPGGDIGHLAVNGTVNDLWVSGAEPIALSLALIAEEGLPLADLERILDSVADAAAGARVQVVAGDTKVVPHGAADKLFLITSGIGQACPAFSLGAGRARPGDRVLLSGSIGDHGAAVMIERERLPFRHPLHSDTADVGPLVRALEPFESGIRFMRDPTRGGLAAVLNELAQANDRIGVTLRESAIPVKDHVRAVLDLLGLDPLHVANEGKVVAVADAACADRIIEEWRRLPIGRDASIIGEIASEAPGQVHLLTSIGGRRVLPLPEGELLPRIC